MGVTSRKKSFKISKRKGRQYNGQKKKDNHWSTKHFPHSDIFFHRKQKSDFYAILHQMKLKKTRTCNFTLPLQTLGPIGYGCYRSLWNKLEKKSIGHIKLKSIMFTYPWTSMENIPPFPPRWRRCTNGG
jgi:hypothetical protein